MINAVRNLQVVSPGEQAQKDSVQEVQIKEATNDLPVEMEASTTAQSDVTAPLAESQVPPVNQAQAQTQATQVSETSTQTAQEPAKEGQSTPQSSSHSSGTTTNTPGTST
jgi:hypothetical protein